MIVYGERVLRGQAGRALLNLASRLGLRGDRRRRAARDPRPRPNGRGLREAGFAPGHGPGYATVAAPGRDARGIAEGLARGDLHSVWLHHADPLRSYPDRALWNRALGTAQTVIAVDSVLTDTIREHADVVFPAEAYAEKDGTLVHPDGRVQRLRQAIGRPRGAGRACRAPACARCGRCSPSSRASSATLRATCCTGAQASQRLFEAVPFYEGLTLDEIGGRGVRWPERDTFVSPEWEPVALEVPAGAPAAADGSLRLGTFRSLWASKEVDASPALQFVRPQQVVELSPADAEALDIREGDRVELGSNGSRVRGAVRLRAAIPTGTRVHRRGHARGSRQRADRARGRGPPCRPRPRRRAFGGARAEHARASRAWPRCRRPRRSCPSRRGISHDPLRRGRLLRALVDADRQGARDLLRGLQPRADRAASPTARCSAASSTATAPTASARSARCSRSPTSASSLFKEQFRPRTASGWLFAVAPIISMMTAAATIAIIPFSDVVDIFGTQTGLYGVDPSIGILFAFAFGGIAFYGLMLGGWASGSKYCFLGSMRAAAQLISYEVAQGLSHRRRDHDGRLAVDDRHRRRGRRRTSGWSARSSSAS